MEEEDLLRLISEGESETVDFKRSLDLRSAQGKTEFIKDVIAIANSASEVGYLLVGVDDDQIIVGADVLDEEQIQQIIQTYVDPNPAIVCQMLSIVSANFAEVGVIKIRGAERPYRVVRSIERLNQNDVFVRHGSIITKASPQEMYSMRERQPSVQGEARQYIRAAETHLRLQNVDQAIAAYTRAIEIAPTSDLYIARGKAYRGRVNPGMQSCLDTEMAALAIKDFSDALVLAASFEQEKDSRLNRLRTYALCDVSILSEERKVGAGVVEDIYAGRDTEDGIWLLVNTQGPEVGEVLYLEERIRYVYSWCGQAFEYWPRDGTISALSKAIDLGYAGAEVYYLRAVAHQRYSNFGLAMDDINIAIARTETDQLMSDCLCGRAAILLSVGGYEEAYRDLTQARELSGSELKSWFFKDIHSIANELLYKFVIAREFGGLLQDDIGIFREVLQILTLDAGHRVTVLVSGGRELRIPRISVNEQYPQIAAGIRAIVGEEVWEAASASNPVTLKVEF